MPQLHTAAVFGANHINLNHRQRDLSLLDNENFRLAGISHNKFPIWHAPFPSVGEPWPQPSQILSHSRFHRLSPAPNRSELRVRIKRGDSQLLQHAIKRYNYLIFEQRGVTYYPQEWQHQEDQLIKLVETTPISFIDITVNKQGQMWPHLDMDESYILKMDNTRIILEAEETWGALRGLETLSQLIWSNQKGVLYINDTYIEDSPRFKHRGILVDTSRHFIRKETLLLNLDSMAYNKMNVFHWHMVDDQSFPFQSETFPNLSNKGAYHPKTMVYSHEDILEIIEYARLRGIRVIPEFDTPGHTHSWGHGYPDLLTPCFNEKQWSGYFGPINPVRNSTYQFLGELFGEVINLFKDKYIHLGGDEVESTCWQNNQEVSDFQTLWALPKHEHILDYYFRRLQNTVTRAAHKVNKNRQFIVWQEAYDKDVLLKPGSIVQVWIRADSEASPLQIAKEGIPIIFSACWYLDKADYGTQWIRFYICDPTENSDINMTPPKWVHNILGGEACMWSEYQSDTSILSAIWPLSSATAERLWSPSSVRSIAEAGPRFEEHRCRMMSRGIPVGVASGPGMCSHEAHLPSSALRESISFFSLEESPPEPPRVSNFMGLVTEFQLGGIRPKLRRHPSLTSLMNSARPFPKNSSTLSLIYIMHLGVCFGTFILLVALVVSCGNKHVLRDLTMLPRRVRITLVSLLPILLFALGLLAWGLNGLLLHSYPIFTRS